MVRLCARAGFARAQQLGVSAAHANLPHSRWQRQRLSSVSRSLEPSDCCACIDQGLGHPSRCCDSVSARRSNAQNRVSGGTAWTADRPGYRHGTHAQAARVGTLYVSDTKPCPSSHNAMKCCAMKCRDEMLRDEVLRMCRPG